MPSVLAIADSFADARFDITIDMNTIETYELGAALIIANEMPMSSLENQVLSCARSSSFDTIRVGLIQQADKVSVIGKALELFAKDDKMLVVSPSVISDEGELLITEDTYIALTEHVYPHATILVPNIMEAELLSGIEIHGNSDAIRATREIAKMYHAVVYLRGGQITNNHDLIINGTRTDWVARPRIRPGFEPEKYNFATSLACELCVADSIEQATKSAAYFMAGIHPVLEKKAMEAQNASNIQVNQATPSEVKSAFEDKKEPEIDKAPSLAEPTRSRILNVPDFSLNMSGLNSTSIRTPSKPEVKKEETAQVVASAMTPEIKIEPTRVETPEVNTKFTASANTSTTKATAASATAASATRHDFSAANARLQSLSSRLDFPLNSTSGLSSSLYSGVATSKTSQTATSVATKTADIKTADTITEPAFTADVAKTANSEKIEIVTKTSMSESSSSVSAALENLRQMSQSISASRASLSPSSRASFETKEVEMVTDVEDFAPRASDMNEAASSIRALRDRLNRGNDNK